jgi:hypothetical protein
MSTRCDWAAHSVAARKAQAEQPRSQVVHLLEQLAPGPAHALVRHDQRFTVGMTARRFSQHLADGQLQQWRLDGAAGMGRGGGDVHRGLLQIDRRERICATGSPDIQMAFASGFGASSISWPGTHPCVLISIARRAIDSGLSRAGHAG